MGVAECLFIYVSPIQLVWQFLLLLNSCQTWPKNDWNMRLCGHETESETLVSPQVLNCSFLMPTFGKQGRSKSHGSGARSVVRVLLSVTCVPHQSRVPWRCSDSGGREDQAWTCCFVLVYAVVCERLPLYFYFVLYVNICQFQSPSSLNL